MKWMCACLLAYGVVFFMCTIYWVNHPENNCVFDLRWRKLMHTRLEGRVLSAGDNYELRVTAVALSAHKGMLAVGGNGEIPKLGLRGWSHAQQAASGPSKTTSRVHCSPGERMSTHVAPMSLSPRSFPLPACPRLLTVPRHT